MLHALAFVVFGLVSSVSVAAANDVDVAVKNGALVVKRDDDANTLTLDQIGLGTDSMRITPDGGTTVNGAGGAQVFNGLVSGAKIALGKGSDRLTLATATLNGPVKIDLGAGDN